MNDSPRVPQPSRKALHPSQLSAEDIEGIAKATVPEGDKMTDNASKVQEAIKLLQTSDNYLDDGFERAIQTLIAAVRTASALKNDLIRCENSLGASIELRERLDAENSTLKAENERLREALRLIVRQAHTTSNIAETRVLCMENTAHEALSPTPPSPTAQERQKALMAFNHWVFTWQVPNDIMPYVETIRLALQSRATGGG